MRLDREFDARGGEPVGQRLPLGHSEHDAEVRHGHVMAVDGVARFGRAFGSQVRNNLVPVEIEIDPVVGAAPFRAPHRPAPERPRLGDVAHRKGEVEGGEGQEPATSSRNSITGRSHSTM